jgi:Glycosyl transferase family 2
MDAGLLIAGHHHLVSHAAPVHVMAATALTATAAHARELNELARARIAMDTPAREESAPRSVARHAVAWLCVLILPRRRLLPGVSVVTPTWRRNALLLNRAIPAVRAQTYPGGIEHVVVSDGPDPVLAAQLPGLRELPFHQPVRNRGVMPRLYGTWAARHEVIAYLDDDNAWRPAHLELLVRALISSGADFAYSRALCHDAARGVRYTIGTPVPELAQIDTSLIVHRRELLAAATWQPSDGPADWYLVSRWMAAGASWVFVPDITLDYYLCLADSAAVLPR